MDPEIRLCEHCGGGIPYTARKRSVWLRQRFCSCRCARRARAPFMSLRAQFESYVERVAGGCWIWRGGVNLEGYGFLSNAGRNLLAHRAAVELDGREIPPGALVCHHCDNPQCVNPAHLYVGSYQTNADDKVRRGRSNSGERQPFAKLTRFDVFEVRYLRAQGALLTEIAAKFGVAKQTVGDIIQRRTWRHV